MKKRSTLKQLSFLPKLEKNATGLRFEHGGETRIKKRKIARPFSQKNPLHVVLRSSRAMKEWSLLTPKNRHRVQKILENCSKRYHVKIYRFVNVGNHLHLLVQTQSKKYFVARAELAAFLRQFAGEIAFQVTGANKSNPIGRFWDYLVYSRIVSWGKEFEVLKKYLFKNLLEANGVWHRDCGISLDLWLVDSS